MFNKKKQDIRRKIKKIFLELIQELKIVNRVSALEERIVYLELQNKALKSVDNTNSGLNNEENLSKICEVVNSGILKLERRIHRLPMNLDYDKRILTHTNSGLRILVDTNDPHIAIHLIEIGVWEPHVQNCMSRLLKSGGVFVDVGANIGLHSLFAKQIIGNEGKLYCFEASQKTFKILSENMELNGFLDVNTWIYNKAVSLENGKVEFQNFEHHAGMSSIKLTKERTDKFKHDNYVTEVVDMVALDSISALRNEEIDVVKIDVENFEYDVMLGMVEIIDSNPNIKIILEFLPQGVIEIHGQQYFSKMIEYMKETFPCIYEILAPDGNLKARVLDVTDMHVCDLLLSKNECI